MDKELIERMRLLETDHEPHGYPPVTMRDVSALCDEIERLRAASGQASFCLRTLAPDDADAQMTVRMLDASLGRA